jgi:diguanylate cyclase (GGDEF)-like protein
VLNETDRRRFEDLIEILVYPLRNACHYAKALNQSLVCPVTQLYNRTAFEKAIVREINYAKRHQTHLSLLLMDLDHFKLINDNYGHLAGDSILAQVATLCLSVNRSTDLIYRYGGEEFVVMLPNAFIPHAWMVAERLRAHIAKHNFMYQHNIIKVTTSIGLAELKTEDNPHSLIQRADKALYQAKKNGRNQAIALR